MTYWQQQNYLWTLPSKNKSGLKCVFKETFYKQLIFAFLEKWFNLPTLWSAHSYDLYWMHRLSFYWKIYTCYKHTKHSSLLTLIIFFFFLIFFWCAPFGYLYFQFFFNVIASTLLTSIQYMAGFEPTTSWTWAFCPNH